MFDPYEPPLEAPLSKPARPIPYLRIWFAAWLASLPVLGAFAVVAAAFCLWLLFELAWQWMDAGSAG